MPGKNAITLEEEVARWDRGRASENNISVCRLVGKMFKEKMPEGEDHPLAKVQYLAEEPQARKESGIRHPRREELHER